MVALLAMLLVGVNVSWAWQGNSTVTLTSNTSANVELAAYTLSGINEGDVVQAQVNGVNQNFYKLGDDDAFVRIEFVNGSDHHKFMPGDELTVTMLSTATGKAGFRLKKNTSIANVEIDATANTAIEVKRTLTADDIDDDGKLTIYRANGVGHACRYYKFAVKCVRYGTDIFVSSNDVTKGTAKLQVSYAQDGETNVPLNTDAVAVSVKSGSNVEFTATPASGKLFWYWKKNGDDSYDGTNPLKVYGVTENLNYQAVFTDGVKHYVYTNDANIGEVHIERDGNDKGKEIHVNPGTPNITFVATEKVENSFKGWFTNVERTTPAPDGADGTKYTDKTYKLNGDQLNNGVTLYAKFEAKLFTVTADWTPTIPANAAGWGLATVHVKVDGVDVDASEYTLNYEVVDGHLSLADGSKNATVTGGFNGTETAHVKVTATPNDPTKYVTGTVTFDVNIKPVAKPNITVTPKTVRIGESVTIGVNRETGFTNPHYEWTLSDNAKTCLYGYTEPISETQEANTDNPTHTFVAKAPTASPISVNLKFYSDNGYYNNTSGRMYEEANASGNNGITVKPVAVPTVYEDIDGVHFTYEQDYEGANGTVDAYLQYYVGEQTEANRVQTGFETSTGTYTATNIPQGTRIYVQSVIRYKLAGSDEYTYVSSDMVEFVTDDAAEFPTLDLMMQPRWKDGIAKRYIPFGVIDEIKKVGEEDVHTPLDSQWPEGVTYGKGAITNNTMGYFLGGNTYPIDKTDKGVCISRNGKAHWAWTGPSTDPNRQYLPKSAAFVMDVAGTMDIVLYAENKFHNSENTTDGNEANRRVIKAWYLNDQCTDGKPVLLKSWGIVGIRGEGNTTGGNELRLHVRLPQLGTNGKATLLFTYEGDGFGNEANDTDHDLWIRGFMIQRPDLTQSIGRTDNKYPDGAKEIKMCVATANTPYVWSFEPTIQNHEGNNIHDDGKDAVGFRPASTTTSKKNNENDGRIYICGDKCDHLLIFSDNYNIDLEHPVSPLEATERPELDGRTGDGRDGKSHIELVRPTLMAGNNGNDDKFNPIRSNGLKVNVTGSGWFKVWASAPNCTVKMKVLTSTNGGNSTIRVLKEFTIPKSTEGTAIGRELDFKPYTAYLKAQVTDGATYDADDATGDPEAKLMSLYVVFETGEGVSLNADGKISGTSEYPQLNINKMSWLNEEPVIYNFQREENPALLTTLRKSDMKSSDPDFYWQMGTSLKENGVDTYNVNAQTPEKNGQESSYGKPSNSNENGGKSGGYVWNIAAPANTNAHTETAHAQKNFDGNEYVSADADNKLEFGSPISGSFLRICAMKNSYIVAHFVQSRENDGNPTVYVMDETGKLVPYCPGADTFNETNLGNFTTEAKMRGCVSNIVGLSESNGVYTTNGEAFRIDIIAPAGKEFFICANNGALSLARLESLGWRIDKVPVITTSLSLTDGGSGNTTAITNSMSGEGRYVKSVTLGGNRTFTAGNWASLVLPFSLNEKKLEEVFGEGTKCLHFTSVDKEKNIVNFTHHFYNMVVAGRPVLICPGTTVTNPEFKDVTLQASTVTSTANDGFEFTGSFDSNIQIKKNDLYVNVSNGVNYYTGTDTYYPGMRSFIKNNCGYDFSKGVTTNGMAKAVFLNFDDMDPEFTTGIEELVTSEFGENAVVVTKSTKVYDLKGRIVAAGADINNLPAGIYIVNGKKFIVK